MAGPEEIRQLLEFIVFSLISEIQSRDQLSLKSRIFRLIVRRPNDGSGIKYKGEIEQ